MVSVLTFFVLACGRIFLYACRLFLIRWIGGVEFLRDPDDGEGLDALGLKNLLC